MGLRGELFSTRVLLQNRTYFFNVKENRVGDLYLNIVESKNRDEGGFDRQSVVLFADDLQNFLKGFDEALRVMEKEVRERRHQNRPAAQDSPASQGPSASQGRAAAREARPDDQRAEKPRRGYSPKTPRQATLTHKKQHGTAPGKSAGYRQKREDGDYKAGRNSGDGRSFQKGKRVVVKRSRAPK
jgi:hypothetical protein